MGPGKSLNFIEVFCISGKSWNSNAGPGNPGKSLNFIELFSISGKSWNSDAGPGKSWKSKLDYIFLLE